MPLFEHAGDGGAAGAGGGGDSVVLKVKHQMQSQLRELEPLPELLRSSELRLKHTNEQLEQFKRLHNHDMTLINDLTAKVFSILITVNSINRN